MKRGDFLNTMKNKKVIIPLIILFLFIGAMFFLLANYFNKDIKEGDYTIYKNTVGKVEKYDSSKVIEGYKGGNKAYYISGDISTSKDKDLVIIIYDLFNKDNKKLGIAKAVLTNVKTNEKYSFKAIGLIKSEEVNNVSYYKFKSVNDKIVKDI